MSETFLRQLFTLLKVHPDFLEIIFLFGEKIGPVEESFGSFFSHCRPQNVQNPFVEPACSYGKGLIQVESHEAELMLAKISGTISNTRLSI